MSKKNSVNNKAILRYSLILIIVLIVFLVFLNLAKNYQNGELNNTNNIIKSEPNILIREYSPIFKATEEERVILVEFMDPECPVCVYAHNLIENIYKVHYKNITKVYRYIDIHKNSELVMHILEASKDQGKYSELLNLFFEKQKVWASNSKNDQGVWKFLENNNIGLDFEKLKLSMKTIDIKTILKQDRADAQVLKVTGTPTVFINGKAIPDLNNLEEIILQEIEKKK